MLSELYHLSKNVAKGQGEANLVHVDFGEPGLTTKTNFKLTLGPNGSIAKFALWESADSKGENRLELWTLKSGNHEYFPAVRPGAPLIQLEQNDTNWETLKRSAKQTLLKLLKPKISEENRENLGSQVQQDLQFDTTTKTQSNGECVGPQTETAQAKPSGKKKNKTHDLQGEREQAERIKKWQHDESDVLAILHEFSKSFLEVTENYTTLTSFLFNFLRKTLAEMDDDKLANSYKALACGHWETKPGKKPKLKCDAQIIFDYQPQGELSGCLYTPQVQRVVLECLNNEKTPAKKARKKAPSSPERFCAFEPDSANAHAILNAPYPDWSVQPIIGKAFRPYSKFSAAPCNFRYAHAGSSGFPVGVETAKKIVGFASGITTEQLRRITWQGIRNGKFEIRQKEKIETFDALIAYPSFKWDELEPVSIFTRPSISDDPDDVDELNQNGTIPIGFKQVAESYVQSLKEKVPERDRNKNYIRLLLLRAISPGQVQLTYSASPTCEEFDAALDCWTNSESYLPERLLIPLPSNKANNGLRWVHPRLLFPDEAIRVFTHQWKREGTDSHCIQAPPIGDIFNVFLRRDGVWQQSASELLESLIPRVEPLLVAAGQRIHLTDKNNLIEWHAFVPMTREGKQDKTKPDPRYFLSQALSLTGTLLHTLNPQNSQHYMKETAYQLGRLLAAIDHLHKCYCDGERDGSYPPTLIGNGLLGRAADSPQEALAELCERGRIYLGWAETAQPKTVSGSTESKEKKKLERQNIAVFSARKLLRIVSPLCVELHQATDLDKPMDSMAKAHLFLGYLTKVLGEKEETNQPNQPTPEDQQA